MARDAAALLLLAVLGCGQGGSPAGTGPADARVAAAAPDASRPGDAAVVVVDAEAVAAEGYRAYERGDVDQARALWQRALPHADPALARRLKVDLARTSGPLHPRTPLDGGAFDSIVTRDGG